MTYKHLTTRELTLIADFWYQGTKAYRAAKLLQRSQETIYRVYRFLNDGKTIDQYLQTYQRHKRRCGRKQTQLPTIEVNYIHAQIKAGWTPDTIIGRHEHPISCSMRTLYRMFARNQYGFSVKQLPMKGKRHPNGYVEHRGKAGQLGRSIYQRYRDFPHYQHEFGHFEADTVQGKAHRGAVMTLVERQSKVMIVLNIHHKTDEAVNCQLDQWLAKLPRHFVKSITFNNGLLRRDGLSKKLDFRDLPDELVTQLMHRRNNIPRKSLNYRTPLEVFLSHVTEEQLSPFF